MDKQYYTTQEIQEIFHLSRTNTYKLMDSTGFPCTRIGKKRLVSVSELRKWQERYNYSSFDY